MGVKEGCEGMMDGEKQARGIRRWAIGKSSWLIVKSDERCVGNGFKPFFAGADHG
jgi:hypothetical protein